MNPSVCRRPSLIEYRSLNFEFSGENPTALSVCSHESATSNKRVIIKVTKIHSTANVVDLGTIDNEETMVLFS